MKKLLVAVTLGMLAVTAPTSAHADGVGFKGGCRFATMNDTTPDGTLGGNNVWNGQVNLLVVANDAGSISANCSIKVNGANQGVVLDAGAGVGVVASVGRVTFTAADTDTVSLCTNVTTSAGSESVCVDATVTDICAEQICGDGGFLDQLNGGLICAVMRALAPIVNPLFAPQLYIDPSDGDVWVYDFRILDCPPYGNPKPRPPKVQH